MTLKFSSLNFVVFKAAEIPICQVKLVKFASTQFIIHCFVVLKRRSDI